MVRAAFERNRRQIPLVARGDLETLAERIQAVLSNRRN